MNDFIIQGVTILGTEITNPNFALFRFVLCVLLSLSFFVFVCLSISEKEFSCGIVCLLLTMLAIWVTFLSYKE